MHHMLTLLTAVMLVGACILSYMNKEKLTNETAVKERRIQEKQLTEKRLADTQDKLAEAKANFERQGEGAQNFIAEIETVNAAVQEKADTLLGMDSDIAQAQATLKGLKDQEMRIGDLDAQAAKLTELRQQTAQLRDQVSSQESVFASLEQQTESVTNQIEAYNDLVEARKNAQMSPQFSTSVRTVYPEWGFVVLGAGNNQGVMEGATLVVRRGGSEVTRLKVTELYQNTSVADILPGGTPPQPGDSVYSVVESSNPATNANAQ